MFEKIREAASLLEEFKHKEVLVVSHSDADGVCAAAILSKCLERRGIEHSVSFVEMPHPEFFEYLPGADLVILADVGSSLLGHLRRIFAGSRTVVLDHHEPDDGEDWSGLVHLNAHMLGIDGGIEVSGAGMAYLFASVSGVESADLSPLAIVGALGDAQDLWGELRGINKDIARVAAESGALRIDNDILLYGRHSRPIYRALAGFTDPFIPGVSGSPMGSLQLLRQLGIRIKEGDRLRRPVDLSAEEKSRLASEMMVRASLAAPRELVPHIARLVVGETFSIPSENDESGLKDASEFATCLNAVSKQDQPAIGLEVAKGDRGGYYEQMKRLLARYRRKIAESVAFVEDLGVQAGPRGYLQFLDATGYVSERMIGTLTGMLLSLGLVDPYRPLVGAVERDGLVKVSARCSRLLALKNVNLAKAMREAGRRTGGDGGGHATAAGAQIDEKKLPEFIDILEENLLRQMT